MKKLRIHYLKHVPFEGLGCIEAWAFEKGYTLTATPFYTTSYQLPAITSIDWLIVMGGPMSVQDEAAYPWLKEEKAFIKQAIATGKTVVGICLGAQLIAKVLGARVYPNNYKEIGWFDVTRTSQRIKSDLLKEWPPSFPVFHWHGDTFDLPEGAEHLLQSEGCANQMFVYKNHVVGIQFHFEITPALLEAMIRHEGHELRPGKYIQTGDFILAQAQRIPENNQRMHSILNNLEHGFLKKFTTEVRDGGSRPAWQRGEKER